MIRNFFKRKQNKTLSHETSLPREKNKAVKEPSFKPVAPLPSAEELCEINPGSMDAEEIRQHLKKLYKRHNEAASSLNKELRIEAESMLDAIVECRDNYVVR